MTPSASLANSVRSDVPIGAVVPYAGPLAETDAGSGEVNRIRAALAAQGWLYCDGQAYPCQDYFQLYAVIGTSFGGDRTTFNVPDLRGRVMRSVDGGAGHAPETRPVDPALNYLIRYR